MNRSAPGCSIRSLKKSTSAQVLLANQPDLNYRLNLYFSSWNQPFFKGSIAAFAGNLTELQHIFTNF